MIIYSQSIAAYSFWFWSKDIDIDINIFWFLTRTFSILYNWFLVFLLTINRKNSDFSPDMSLMQISNHSRKNYLLKKILDIVLTFCFLLGTICLLHCRHSFIKSNWPRRRKKILVSFTERFKSNVHKESYVRYSFKNAQGLDKFW